MPRDKLLKAAIAAYKAELSADTPKVATRKASQMALEVINATEKYGDLKALEVEIEKFSAKRDELESRVKELNKGTSTGSDFFGDGEILSSFSPTFYRPPIFLFPIMNADNRM